MKFCFGLALLCAFSVAQGLVCTKDFCKKIACDNLDDCESRNGIVREKAGICNCCDHCVIQLKEGESCFEYFEIGMPPNSECGENLYCDEVTWTCIREDPAIM